MMLMVVMVEMVMMMMVVMVMTFWRLSTCPEQGWGSLEPGPGNGHQPPM